MNTKIEEQKDGIKSEQVKSKKAANAVKGEDKAIEVKALVNEHVTDDTADSAKNDQSKGKKIRKRFNVTEGILCIKSTLNNTIVSMCDMNGNVLKQESAGTSFKGSKKGTPYAAYIVADRIAKWADLAGIVRVCVRVNGIGNGKDMVIRTIHQKGLSVLSICDTTPVPHGGCRPRKARRV